MLEQGHCPPPSGVALDLDRIREVYQTNKDAVIPQDYLALPIPLDTINDFDGRQS